MNPRQRKFAHEYVKLGFNGVQAVLAAGYRMGYDSACVHANYLLRNPKVQQMVEDTLNEAKLDAERVSKEIATVAYSQVESIDSAAKMKALDLATKVLGMQSSKLETVDLTQQSAAESALLKSISSAAQRDGISQENAAISLFDALKDDPQFCDLSTWPAEYRAAIQQSLQKPEQITEIGDQ